MASATVLCLHWYIKQPKWSVTWSSRRSWHKPRAMAEQRAPRLGPSKSVMNTKQSKAFASPSIPSSAFDNQYIDATLSKGKSSYSSPSKAQTAFPLPPLTQHNNAYTRLPRPESPVYKAEALKGLDFLIQYEFTRAALHAGSPPTNESYNALAEPYIRDLVDARVSSKQTFRVLQRVVQNNNPEAFKSFTNRTSDTMWNKMLDGVWKNSGYLTGKFILEPKGMQKDNTLGAPTRANSNQTFVDKNCKAHQFLSLKLSPPSFMTGNRYFRRFGSDRFLFLSLPNLDEIKEKGNSGELYAAFRESVNVDREKFRLDICKWLANTGGIEVANRLWVPYYLREKEESKGKNNNKKVKVFQVIFFATAGVGIGNSLGGRFETPVHEELSREKLLDWQIYITRAKFQTVAKLWSRISLALSTSTPTITFDWKQIRLVPDLTSPETGEVMDDGCCRISHAAMGEVRAALGLSKKPAAVQGRVGGAKGVWFVDPNNHSDDIWICVNESQMKYGWHRSDQKGTTNEPSRLTLDVLNCSKAMTPAKLNSQLIAILDAGRVPFEVLAVLAREFIDARLEEVASALKNRVALREWVYKQGALTQSRRREKSVDSLGGVPMIVQERAVLLLESGFMPQANPYLRDLLEASLEEFVFQAKDKLHIEVPQSTVVMCIADPCGVLEEGECWLALKDDEIPGLDEQNVVGDILVARNPALLPSDIQKVRAVEDKERYKGLRMLKDVIVFSTKGPYSLASKLSGGDYDGDKVWCTWDARLVEPFQNSPVPREEEVGYDKNEWFFTDKTEVKDVMRTGDVWATDFYERAFQLSTVESMLGMYTYHHSECAYIYGLKDRRSQALAFVCGALVDAPKQGYVLKPNHEGILRKKVDLSPAKNGLPYRDSKSDWTPPIGGWTNVLDRLVFDVIGNYLQSRHDELRALMTPPPEEDFQEDPDLALPSQEFEEEMTPVQQQMRHQLTRELDQILQTWNKHWSVKDKTLEKQSKKKRGNGKASKDAEGPWGDENFEDSGFRELVEGLRESFLEIAPAPELAEQDSLLRAYARRDKVTGELKNEEWQRLKASFAYRLWPQAKIKRDGSKEVKKVVWWVAGYELCAIKIAAGGGGQVVGKRRADGTELVVRSGGNGYRPVLSDVYVSLRTMKDWEVVGLEGDGDGLEENKEFGGWE
ncbi:RdRP-domain-containing protein [Ascobolus immersus RN42]|uniref:RNA-dependent RNA polymerase n=1 Tax=Ascobolus immersus RN42 TaxID=1160509 RepID=A0A3N4HQR6_ASCIM|nr:RdRP-domain-containing protein [Ascobolus immersus RN42]